MFPNSWYDARFLCPLVEILETLQVGDVLLFIRGLRECDGDMLPGNPFVKVVFDLDSESISYYQEGKKRTYNCQNQGHCRQQEHLIFEKLRVHHAVVLFSSEPRFVDEHLDDRCKKNSRFLLRVLLGWGQRLGCKI